jgi:hypothetical protein
MIDSQRNDFRFGTWIYQANLEGILFREREEKCGVGCFLADCWEIHVEFYFILFLSFSLEIVGSQLEIGENGFVES